MGRRKVKLKIGRINITTTETGDKHKVVLDMAYPYNITFDNADGQEVEFNPASIPYTFFIENKGFTNNTLQIDIHEWAKINQNNLYG